MDTKENFSEMQVYDFSNLNFQGECIDIQACKSCVCDSGDCKNCIHEI